eukprot:2644818-Amphidinium_carterae.1
MILPRVDAAWRPFCLMVDCLQVAQTCSGVFPHSHSYVGDCGICNRFHPRFRCARVSLMSSQRVS